MLKLYGLIFQPKRGAKTQQSTERDCLVLNMETKMRRYFEQFNEMESKKKGI